MDHQGKMSHHKRNSQVQHHLVLEESHQPRDHHHYGTSASRSSTLTMTKAKTLTSYIWIANKTTKFGLRDLIELYSQTKPGDYWELIVTIEVSTPQVHLGHRLVRYRSRRLCRWSSSSHHHRRRIQEVWVTHPVLRRKEYPSRLSPNSKAFR